MGIETAVLTDEFEDFINILKFSMEWKKWRIRGPNLGYVYGELGNGTVFKYRFAPRFRSSVE